MSHTMATLHSWLSYPGPQSSLKFEIFWYHVGCACMMEGLDERKKNSHEIQGRGEKKGETFLTSPFSLPCVDPIFPLPSLFLRVLIQHNNSLVLDIPHCQITSYVTILLATLSQKVSQSWQLPTLFSITAVFFYPSMCAFLFFLHYPHLHIKCSI